MKPIRSCRFSRGGSFGMRKPSAGPPGATKSLRCKFRGAVSAPPSLPVGAMDGAPNELRAEQERSPLFLAVCPYLGTGGFACVSNGVRHGTRTVIYFRFPLGAQAGDGIPVERSDNLPF